MRVQEFAGGHNLGAGCVRVVGPRTDVALRRSVRGCLALSVIASSCLYGGHVPLESPLRGRQAVAE